MLLGQKIVSLTDDNWKKRCVMLDNISTNNFVCLKKMSAHVDEIFPCLRLSRHWCFQHVQVCFKTHQQFSMELLISFNNEYFSQICLLNFSNPQLLTLMLANIIYVFCSLNFMRAHCNMLEIQKDTKTSIMSIQLIRELLYYCVL